MRRLFMSQSANVAFVMVLTARFAAAAPPPKTAPVAAPPTSTTPVAPAAGQLLGPPTTSLATPLTYVPPVEPKLPALTMEDAVAIALQRNRDVIAAKLDIQAAELDRVAAGVYWNPTLSYSIQNLVLGRGGYANSPEHPGFFSEPEHTVGVSEVIDIWAKRSGRIRAADEAIRYRRYEVEDAIREIVYDVRSAFADVVREQSERDLSLETRDRYAETVRLSRARFSAGEISDAELRKIELEGLKYENDVIDAGLEFELAKEKLAALIGIGTDLPYSAAFPLPRDFVVSIPALTSDAFQRRPDLLATRAAARVAEATLGSARREAYPDISLGVAYSHSAFQVSGDNPNTLGFSVSTALPFFDRNQAGIGRAELDRRRAENDAARIELMVRHEVSEAAHRVDRAKSLISVYESGGMLARADLALTVAEKSYRAGAISLLELLEARRTYIETRGSYLRAQHDYRQSIIDLYHAVGGSPK